MYKVDLIFNNQEKLSYRSIDTEFTKWYFENCILKSYSSIEEGNSKIDMANTHYSFPYFADKINLINTLNGNIETLQGMGYTIPYTVDINTNQETLNRLHEYFHTSVENQVKLEYSKEVDQALLDLNYNIHKLESTLQQESSNKNYAVVTLKNFEASTVSLSTENKKHFTLDFYKEAETFSNSKYKGYVNYSTVGKNLYHAYFNNDIQLIKDKLIRNKTNGDNMIHFDFSPQDQNKYVYNCTPDKIKEWLESHNIKNVEEVLTEENLNQFYPPILDMTEESVNKYTLKEIYRLFTEVKIKDIYINKED